MNIEHKYCAYIDVLGYGSIVNSNEITNDQKKERLLSIFRNLHSTISMNTIKTLKEKYKEKELFVKSFSDSIYIQSDDPILILFSLYNIFNTTFGYYKNSSYKQNPTIFLRAGIVKDWTLKIMDLGSLSRNEIESMPNNEELQNIIGQGVANAYYTSEKKNLSGMRIIISPEVLNNVPIIKYDKVDFECYYLQIDNPLYNSELISDFEKIKLFFIPIKHDEINKYNNRVNEVNLFELCWPVFKYSWSNNLSDIDSIISELFKIQDEFNGDAKRHLRETAKLIYKSLQIVEKETPNVYLREDLEIVKKQLLPISNSN